MNYVYALGTRPLAQNGGAWEYLLADALGSVRQIVDEDGNVTLAESYEPYGSVLSSNGTASSIFAYAGEQVDTSGLVFLRARYMQPRLGVFLARDPWGGDQMRPGSMNGFGYVGGRPITFVDPSGKEPERPGLKDGTGPGGGPEYEYSCMCGWIDWNHADSAGGVVLPIRDAQLEDRSIFGYGFYETVYINQHEGPKMGETGGVYGSISVSRGMGKNTRQMFEVSLGVWESLNNLFEGFQRGDQFPLRTVGDIFLHSGFSEEDTTSDLLAFYRTAWEETEYLTHDQSKQRVRELCQVIGMDDEPSVRLQKQQDIFDKYTHPMYSIGGFKDNYEWGNPRLVDIDNVGIDQPFGCATTYCSGKSRQFPQKFQEYNAVPPQVGGLWSWLHAHAEIHWHYGPINYDDYYVYNTQDLNK
jgi:RHS repeat-associated protein